jgi:hypothetical protein
VGRPDFYTVRGGDTLDVPPDGVLENDEDVDGDPLEARRILGTGPQNGVLNLMTDGSFTYTPDSGFFGDDTFQYEAVDPDEASSGPVLVTISVTDPLPWRNPENPFDVNADRFVTSIDALIIINYINKNGQGPVPDPAPPGPPFPDPVSPDNLVTNFDVLAVVNMINAGGLGEGEVTTSSEGSSTDKVAGEAVATQDVLDTLYVVTADGKAHNASLASTSSQTSASVTDFASNVDAVLAAEDEADPASRPGAPGDDDVDELIDSLASTEGDSDVDQALDDLFGD